MLPLDLTTHPLAARNPCRYNPSTGEIAGVFESVQPSDTDMGAKAAREVKISGIWYAQLVKN